MIRTDQDHQWASTQMAIHEATPTTPAKWPLEEGRKQNGLDYQGRFPEAAHAAIDWDDNEEMEECDDAINELEAPLEEK